MKIFISYLHADAVLVFPESGIDRSGPGRKTMHLQTGMILNTLNDRLVIPNSKRYFNGKHA
jgi:hypothetical protein